MNVHTIVVLAAALAAVCDVSSAAQPAVIKSIQPQAQLVTTVSAKPEQSLRSAGQQAQQQILREAMQTLAADALVMPAAIITTADVAVLKPELADVAKSSAQLAVK
jgi:hypothetical protein